MNRIRINFPEHILIVGYTSGILKPQHTWVREAQDTTNSPGSTWVREPKKAKIDPICEEESKTDRIEEFFSRIKNKPANIANVPNPPVEKPKPQNIIRKEGT